MSDLPEPPADDAVELASRYVDGDLSVDERAAAEADPEVMAWVERFGGIRAALREPVEIDAATRDDALAAALATFDDTSMDGAVAPPPGVSDLAAARARRAGRMGRWLGTAAAIVAVGVGGVVLVSNSDGSNDDSSDARTETAAASTKLDASAADAADQDSATYAQEVAPAAAPADSTVASGAGGSALESAATTSPGSSRTDAGGESTEAPSETRTGAATTTTPTANDGAASITSFAAPADLARLTTATPITTPPGDTAPCADEASGDLVAIDVTYGDMPAVVYRDDQIHTLTAWAVDGCTRLGDYVYPEE